MLLLFFSAAPSLILTAKSFLLLLLGMVIIGIQIPDFCIFPSTVIFLNVNPPPLTVIIDAFSFSWRLRVTFLSVVCSPITVNLSTSILLMSQIVTFFLFPVRAMACSYVFTASLGENPNDVSSPFFGSRYTLSKSCIS